MSIKKAKEFKMKKQNNDLELLIENYSLKKLDESDQTAVLRMLKNMKDYKKTKGVVVL